MHIASVGGFPPNEDTGKLRQGTIHYPKARKTGRSLVESTISSDARRAGASVNYAIYLEDGTVRMKARPFFYSTILNTIFKAKFQKIIRQVQYRVENVLRGKVIRPGRRRVV